MRARFTQSFKIQAVEKALERANDVTLKNMADELGVRALGSAISSSQSIDNSCFLRVFSRKKFI